MLFLFKVNDMHFILFFLMKCGILTIRDKNITMCALWVSGTMRRFLLETVIICTLSVGCGVVFSFILTDSLLIFKSYRTVSQTGATSEARELWPEEIDAESLGARLETDQIILLDARDPVDFRNGHIPSALNFPVRQFESRYQDWLSRLSPEKTIVTYCSNQNCLDSRFLAEKLLEIGFPRVLVFSGGIEKWKEKGYEITKGDIRSRGSDG